MALRSPLFSSGILPKSLKPQINRIPNSVTLPTNRTNFSISCTSDTSDAELAAGLAAEMAKINIKLVQKEEAMKKSKELLFKEFSKHLGLEAEEVKQRWRKLDDKEKMVWAKGFVNDWGEAFHPLSSKSVKEMVDEILVEDKPKSISSEIAILLGWPSQGGGWLVMLDSKALINLCFSSLLLTTWRERRSKTPTSSLASTKLFYVGLHLSQRIKEQCFSPFHDFVKFIPQYIQFILTTLLC